MIKQKGFTLIELMVTLVILGFLIIWVSLGGLVIHRLSQNQTITNQQLQIQKLTNTIKNLQNDCGKK